MPSHQHAQLTFKAPEMATLTTLFRHGGRLEETRLVDALVDDHDMAFSIALRHSMMPVVDDPISISYLSVLESAGFISNRNNVIELTAKGEVAADTLQEIFDKVHKEAHDAVGIQVYPFHTKRPRFLTFEDFMLHSVRVEAEYCALHNLQAAPHVAVPFSLEYQSGLPTGYKMEKVDKIGADEPRLVNVIALLTRSEIKVIVEQLTEFADAYVRFGLVHGDLVPVRQLDDMHNVMVERTDRGIQIKIHDPGCLSINLNGKDLVVPTLKLKFCVDEKTGIVSSIPAEQLHEEELIRIRAFIGLLSHLRENIPELASYHQGKN